MATAKTAAPTSKKAAAQNKPPAPKRVGVAKLPDIAKGRGRPSAVSQGLAAKRQYKRVVTEEVLSLRRVGEALFGRNWKVDFASAVQYDAGLITRILVGTRAVPDDMAKRVKKALTEQRKRVTEALKSPLLVTPKKDPETGEVPPISLTEDMAAEFTALGIAVWGTYWKRDMAEAINVDPGLMTNALKGNRAASYDPALLKAAIKARGEALGNLRNDPYLTPASPGETVAAD